MTTRRSPLLIALALAIGAVGAHAQTSQRHDAHMYASAVSGWHTGADGSARMNLVGDSTMVTGLSTFRLRYPVGAGDSTRARVQCHLGTEHIFVLRGTLVVGLGDSLDFSALKEFGSGGFLVIPSGQPHYEWTRGESEVQVEAIGPSVTHPWPRLRTDATRTRMIGPARDVASAQPNGLSEWRVHASDVSVMDLAGGPSPSPTELVAFRVRYPSGFLTDSAKLYHFHFGTEHITIPKSTLYFAVGDVFDRSKAKRYGPGSFIENPGGAKHFEWSRATSGPHRGGGITRSHSA